MARLTVMILEIPLVDVGSETPEQPAQAMGADVPTASPQAIDLHDPRQLRTVEEAIRAIPEVLGTRLVPGFGRQVDELHVLTTLDKAPKQTVRDVQSVLMARFAVPTDHRVISVVQLNETTSMAPANRVAIESVGLTQAGLTAVADVVLVEGDDRHTGSAEDSATSKGRARVVAAATLDAASGLIGHECRVGLDAVDVIDIAGQRLAVCLLNVKRARGEAALAGSAIVRDAEPDAIARAVLDALNRTISDVTV